MVPKLLMPPNTAALLVTTMPSAYVVAVIWPELLMPPDTVALLVTTMPSPDVGAVIWPALMMAPPTDALLMVMPVRVGVAKPVGVMMPVLGGPVLITLPVTAMPWILMQ